MHTSPNFLRRARFLIAGCALAAASCNDGSTEPEPTPVGYYRLVSMDGRPVPYASGGRLVRSGDLVLRDNQSAVYGVRGAFLSAPIFEGTYAISGKNIEFRFNGVGVVTGTIEGDSVSVTVRGVTLVPSSGSDVPFAAVFRKQPPDPVAVTSGTYIMTHDGYRVVYGQPGAGVRVDWDSLTFIDAVFFRRSRRVTNRIDSTNFGQTSYVRYGTYRGNASALLLSFLEDTTSTVTAPSRDSLIVQNGALVRRYWTAERAVEERFERRP